MSALIVPIVILGLKLGSFVAIAVLLCLSGILCLRMTILRCHDLGWSQWLAAIQLIPYVGAIFTLILLVVPGNRDENAHGLPTPIAGWAPFAFSVVIAIGSVFSMRNDLGSMMMALAAAQGQYGSGKGRPSPQAYQPESGPPVVLYSDNTCDECATRRQELATAGISYREISLENNPSAHVRLQEAVFRSGMDNKTICTPILEVKGIVLPNGTGVAEVQAVLQATH